MTTNQLYAGAAQCDISPKEPEPLIGYPHVARISTGIHDPLLASALFLGNESTQTLFVGCDVIFISKALSQRVRVEISKHTGIPINHIVVSATHTHSGPRTGSNLNLKVNPSMPGLNEEYVRQLEEGIVLAACRAWEAREPAEAGLVATEVREIGGNRHDPAGLSNPVVPVMMVRALEGQRTLAVMVITSVHPTVLHEDSTVVSGDFPGLARVYLQDKVLGKEVPVIYHTGTAGNQSPRHVTRSNTIEEAARLGEILGRAVEGALSKMEFQGDLPVTALFTEISLPARHVPSVTEAEAALKISRQRLDSLREAGAPRTEVRTAECDWFGAENCLTLAKATEEGHLQATLDSILPIGIHVIALGKWTYVALPGEIFVEFGLEISRSRPNTFVFAYANGEMEGYITTREAVERAYYEAGSSKFANPEAGECIVRAAVGLLGQLPPH